MFVFAENTRSAETDVTSMVMSRTTEAGSICQLVDMGAFHLAEFAQTLCLPFVGSAVHGGVHVVQVVAQKLAMRMLMVPPLDDTFKACSSPAMHAKYVRAKTMQKWNGAIYMAEADSEHA